MKARRSAVANVLTSPYVAPPSQFTADFSPTANPIDPTTYLLGLADGGDWTNPKSTGGQAVASSTPTPSRYSDDIAVVKSSIFAFSANQFAQGTVYKAPGYTGNGGNHELELLFRFSISSEDAHGYELLWGITGYLALVRWNGGVGLYTPVYDPGLGSAPTWNDGDVLRGELSGNLFTARINGNIVTGFNGLDITSVGSTWNTGQCGFGFWPVDNAINEDGGWKAYTAGNL